VRITDVWITDVRITDVWIADVTCNRRPRDSDHTYLTYMYVTTDVRITDVWITDVRITDVWITDVWTLA
jgi:hypothetical protein